MYLKQMEIVGFKSFSDRVKLDFEPGITAIVGPNGCGKSNIIDAIRWCLGEMSVKSLRSSMMMDVVFNGSGSRPPQNMAEVTLTFDNTDKRLPIDYTDVSISRRLFRSGESEYYINKTQCRLRDIKELFLDTGMGEDGYSSMEQGKIEWILQAKPEQRRELFEEAAGVSKYRARREEALRKLDRVEIDLSRLSDIIFVTNDQIKKLESAVNRAKTYQRIREELKTMEIGDWLAQLNSSEQEMQSLTQNLNEHQNKLEELNTKSHQLDADVTSLRLEFSETEEELLSANSALSSVDSDIKIGEERLQNSILRESELAKQSDNTSSNILREESRITELNLQQQTQQQSLEQIKTDGASIESDYDSAKNAYDACLNNLEEKKNQVKAARDLILDRAQERARTQQQVATLSSDGSRLESQLQSSQKEKYRVEADKQQQLIQQENLNSHLLKLDQEWILKSGLLKTLDQDVSDLSAKEETIRSQMLSTSEEIARLKGQIHSIQAQQSQDPYLAGSQSIISMGFAGIHGPLGRLIQCSDHDRDLVVSTIGEHLGDLVAETTEDAQKVIDFLSQSEKGRARIWILNRLPQTQESELGELSAGEKLSSRIQIEEQFRPLLNHLTSSLWIQGSTVYGRAVMNGGIDPSKWKSHTTHRLPELEKSLTEKEAKKLLMEQDLAALNIRESELKERRESVVKELEQVRIRLELTKQDAAKIEKQISALKEEQDVVNAEIKIQEEEKSKALSLLQESQSRFDQLQSQEQTDHHQLDLLHQEMTELQMIHANANADLLGKSERHNSFQEKLNWQHSIIDHTVKELEAIQKSIEHQHDLINQLSTEMVNAKKTQEEASQLIETSLSKRQVFQEACSAVQKKRTTLSEKIQTIEADLHVTREDLSSKQETIQNYRIQETTLKNKQETLTQKLHEQYELTIELAKAQFTPLLAEFESLDKLKKRINNIGPINLAAPQEHAELSEKNNFLIAQQTDLLKAKDDLKQVITKINATTREHFKETFEKVRTNFRTLYGQLFQGGEADLKLTDESDILSCGIDIFCQPPGKKLLHISLLSGGEKALTACALLFSFFQVRPSPVALLDEVDAPLDEANILRFVDLVKLFSEKSQFFMISHNKRTMEAANTLYGVTMEELGVSKILSARLSKEKKKIEESIESETPASV